MKNGKLFGKLSVIDVAVILLILLLAVAAAVRLGWFSSPDEAIESTQEVVYEKVNCTVTLSFQNVSALVLDDPIAVGDTMMLSNKVLGKVTSVKRAPYTMPETLQNGATVTADQGDAYTYNVEVEATLTRKDGYLRGEKGDVISVGQIHKFKTRYFHGKATVTKVVQ